MSSYADRGRPEPELFLRKAMRTMKAHRAQHGRYADRWDQLDITFALPSYHRDDLDIRPVPGTGTAWRPRGCRWTYMIRHATATTVSIQGVNARGDVDYEIEQGMDNPRWIAPPGRPEPALFLWKAIEAMEGYHATEDRYPDRWDELYIKFAMPSYLPDEYTTHPPHVGGDPAAWRPRGCAWTYVIKHATATTFLIQAVNDRGGADYEIEQGMKDPRKLGSSP
jgi:hypothetical protein